MKHLKQYRIPFSGLSTGSHSFEFEVDEKFFACYEHTLVHEGKLTAIVELQKKENLLIANFDIQGLIKLDCDVCLSTFDSPVSVKERILVKFTDDEWEDATEEVITLAKNDYEMDIAPLLYEYINLAVPPYAKCSVNGQGVSCDPDMLSRIESEKPNDHAETDEEELPDPRWEALKNIKNN